MPYDLPDNLAVDWLQSIYPDVDLDLYSQYRELQQNIQQVELAVATSLDKRFGLSDGRFRVLLVLVLAGDAAMTPSDLAERAGVTRATITGLLDGLEQSGMVMREPHPSDRRRLIVRLSEHGNQVLRQAIPAHFGAIGQVMAGLAPDERRVLINAAAKLRNSAAALQNA